LFCFDCELIFALKVYGIEMSFHNKIGFGIPVKKSTCHLPFYIHCYLALCKLLLQHYKIEEGVLAWMHCIKLSLFICHSFCSDAVCTSLQHDLVLNIPETCGQVIAMGIRNRVHNLGTCRGLDNLQEAFLQTGETSMPYLLYVMQR